MNKAEIMNYIEDQIEYHCDEFGLTRKEVTGVVLLNCIEYFYKDELSEEDLVKCANYLKYRVDLHEVEEEKIIRQKRKAKC